MALAVALAAGAIFLLTDVKFLRRTACFVAYLGLFLAVWRLSLTQRIPTWAGFAAVLCLLALTALLLPSRFKSGGLLVALGFSVAFFSGQRGDADPMASFLRGWGWLSAESVEAIVVGIRKTIHVVFYGALAGVGACFARPLASGSWLVFGLLWALGHAVFDESRQMLTPSRSGSAWDVVLDLGGMLLVLGYLRHRLLVRNAEAG